MTVIAWDGKNLAADRMMVTGGGIARATTKIERHVCPQRGVALLAVIGALDTALELKAWWKAGADPKEFPESARKAEATLAVIVGPNRTIHSYCAGPYPATIEAGRCAWGSGRDYAEAAMYLGKDSREAVEVACVFQSDCGLGVDVL